MSDTKPAFCIFQGNNCLSPYWCNQHMRCCKSPTPISEWVRTAVSFLLGAVCFVFGLLVFGAMMNPTAAMCMFSGDVPGCMIGLTNP